MTVILFSSMADLAELTFYEKRDYVETLRALHAKGKRTAETVEAQAQRLPVYEEIARVLRRQAERVAAQAEAAE